MMMDKTINSCHRHCMKSFFGRNKRRKRWKRKRNKNMMLGIFLVVRGCPGQFARISTNPTGPEVNDHVSLQWSLYEQSQGSNLRLLRKQISWSQVFIIMSSSRWLKCLEPWTIIEQGRKDFMTDRKSHRSIALYFVFTFTAFLLVRQLK
jgi:hypothetical protein